MSFVRDFYVSWILFLIFGGIGCSQCLAIQTQAAHVTRADSLFQKGEYRLALEVIAEAEEIHDSLNFDLGFIKGRILYADQKYVAALEAFQVLEPGIKADSSLSTEKIAKYYLGYGSAYDQLGQGENCYLKLRSALFQVKDQFPDQPSILLSDILLALGENALSYLGDRELARLYFRAALEMCPDETERDRIQATTVWLQIAGLQKMEGKFEEALATLDRVLKIRTAVFGDSHNFVGNVHQEIGSMHHGQQEYETALAHYQKALGVYEAQVPQNANRISVAHNNIGSCLGAMHKEQEALTHYRESMKAKLSLFGTESLQAGLAYLNYGMQLIYIGQIDSATFYYDRCLSIHEKQLPATHPNLAQIHIEYASLFEATHDWKGAIRSYHRAMSILDDEFEGGSILDQPQIHDSRDPQKMLVCLEWKAKALHHWAWEAELNTGLLALSHQTSRLVMDQIDFILSGYLADETKLTIAKWTHEDVEVALEVALLLADLTNEEQFRWEAFEFAEKARGIVLRDGVNRVQAESFSGISRDLIDLERSSAQKVRKLKTQLESDSLSIEESITVGEEYQVALQVYQSVLDRIEHEFPNYHQMRFRSQRPLPTDIQGHMAEQNAAWIEYFVGKNCVTGFVIHPNGISDFSFERDREFRKRLTQFNRACASPPALDQWAQQQAELNELAVLLHEIVLEPAKHVMRREYEEPPLIWVVPDGQLAYLPFHALKEDSEAPFLAENHTVGYGFSLMHHLQTTQNKNPAASSEGWIAYRFDKGATFASGENLAAVSDKDDFLHSLSQTEVFTGGQMTESHFKQHAPQASHIHLATHAVADASSPPRIYFQEGGTAQEDGILHAEEIYAMDLSTDLLVLRACATGSGRFRSGEGVMSLGHAFAFAGAKSQVLSLWPVDDGSSAELLSFFYEELEAGNPAVKGLNAAQGRMISRGGEAVHPYYWGGFVGVGGVNLN